VALNTHNKGQNHTYFVRHFLGKLSLKRAFWINLALPLFLVLASLPYWDRIESYIGNKYSTGGVWLSSVVFFVVASLTVIWQVIGTWRSSDSPTTSRASTAFVKTFLIFYALIIPPNLLLLATNLRSVSLSDFTKKEFEVLREGSKIKITGYLEYGISDVFAKELARSETVLVVLDSKGGMVSEARNIASIIERLSLPTVIAGECLSACTTVFAAGSDRIILNNSNIGFHSPSFLFNRNELTMEIAEEYYAPLLSKGFPLDMIEGIISTPPEGMWYAPTMPLYESGFITSIASNLNEVELGLGVNLLNNFSDVANSNLHESGSQQEEHGHRESCDLSATEHRKVVSINAIDGSSLCFPILDGFLAFQSGDSEFEVFNAMTYEKNKLLLVLVLEKEYLSPDFETEGFNLYALIQRLIPEVKVDEELFTQTKEYMTLYYDDLIKQIQEEKLQTELEKGAQRVSQTIQADVRVQDVKFNSIKLIESNEYLLTYEFEMVTRMSMESEFQHIEQRGLMSYLLIDNALIMINWYETKDSSSSQSRLHKSYMEYLKLLGIKH